MKIEKQMLTDWQFAVGDTMDCLENGHTVQVPHTWNIEEGTEEYWGIGWYRKELEVPEAWLAGCVRLYFHSVYHDAVVYVEKKQENIKIPAIRHLQWTLQSI